MACALGTEQSCSECRMCDNVKVGKKVTNYEKIKGMSVEELAEFLLKVNNYMDYGCKFGSSKGRDCKDCFKEWLESECDEE